jgi:hypothetical protein
MAKTFKSSDNKSKPSQDEIAKRAYEIFERNGRKPGEDLANWLAAESELMNEKSSAPVHPARIQPGENGYRQGSQRR